MSRPLLHCTVGGENQTIVGFRVQDHNVIVKHGKAAARRILENGASMTSRATKLMAATLALSFPHRVGRRCLGQLSCNVAEAAGKVRAQPRLKETGAFRVFWQVSTQIEDLADAESIPGCHG